MTIAETILAALLAVATRGECPDADDYPAGTSRATTGYIAVGKAGQACVIPTVSDVPGDVACDIVWRLNDPHFVGPGIRCEVLESKRK